MSEEECVHGVEDYDTVCGICYEKDVRLLQKCRVSVERYEEALRKIGAEVMKTSIQSNPMMYVRSHRRLMDILRTVDGSVFEPVGGYGDENTTSDNVATD